MSSKEEQKLTEIVKLAMQNAVLNCPKGKSIEKRLRVIELVLIGLLISIFGMNGYSLFFAG